MLRGTRKFAFAVLIIGMAWEPGFAADYQSMTNEELAAMRSTMREASEEERNAFRTEWQHRMNTMSQEERDLAIGRPEGALRDGSGAQSRKGNGGGNRQMRSAEDRDSSSMGAGRGGGMGRGVGGRGR